MENDIIEILKKESKAYSVNELEELLNVKTVDDLKELMKTLNKMEEELKVYRSNKNKYMLFNNSHLKIGKLIGNKKGFGFVDIEGDSDVYISSSNMNGAIHQDRVIVEIISKNGLELEGRIVKVVDRNLKTVVGEIVNENGKIYLKSDESKLNIKINIDKNKTLGAMPGHKVLVKITGKIKDNIYGGVVIKILGHKNDPGVDILSIVYKYGINDVFSDEVMSYVDNIPSEVLSNEYEGRKDLRNEEIFTIDGDDTKDIDDAISIKKKDDNYILGVHIADVSYYVKENTVLDKEAYERGTSVYLADRVIPMLPHKLSNGICSLNPNVDRLAISCEMEIDLNGNVVNYDIFESVINSKKQMTYKNVNKYLEDNIVEDGYEQFTHSLDLMNELAHILRKNKDQRGNINFDIDEAKIIVNDDGEAIDVVVRERGEGEKLIEDFMIVANETVATHIYFMNLPFIYRIHGEPSEEKIQDFIKFISILGIHINGKVKDVHHPKTIQSILSQLEDREEYPILSSLLLRSMQKAVYDKNNIGHFGLASKCYTHFTSPIRRYPDTTVHRLLRKYLFKKQLDTDTINYWDNELSILGPHTSSCEQRAVDCEREVDDMKKAEYMMKHIGEVFDGVISSVMSFGIFVELPNLIEGLIKIDDLKDDNYIYDERIYALKGTRHKKIYRLGDKIKVVVKNANKEAKTVDFEIYEEKN